MTKTLDCNLRGLGSVSVCAPVSMYDCRFCLSFVHQREMVNLGDFLSCTISEGEDLKMFRVPSLPIKHGMLFLFYKWGTEAQIILGWSTLNRVCLPWQIPWFSDNPICGSGWSMLQFPSSPCMSTFTFFFQGEEGGCISPWCGVEAPFGEFRSTTSDQVLDPPVWISFGYCLGQNRTGGHWNQCCTKPFCIVFYLFKSVIFLVQWLLLL